MEFSYKKKTLLLALCLIWIACSDDDSEQESGEVIRNLLGTVIEDTTCNTENNGLAYIVQVEDFDLYEFVITGILPDEFKVAQLRIRFDMRQSSEEITVCTGDLPPEQIFVLTNISLLEN